MFRRKNQGYVSDYPVVKASGIGGRPLRRMKYIEAKRSVSVVEIFTVSSNVKCLKELRRVLGQMCLPLYCPYSPVNYYHQRKRINSLSSGPKTPAYQKISYF